MTSEIKVEEALATMREIAPQLGKAKAERVQLEEFRKSKKALLFTQAPQGTIADRENWAYAHDEYLALLDALKTAVEEEETLKWRMKAAELYVEVWRTQSANSRSIDRGHR